MTFGSKCDYSGCKETVGLIPMITGDGTIIAWHCEVHRRKVLELLGNNRQGHEEMARRNKTRKRRLNMNVLNELIT